MHYYWEINWNEMLGFGPILHPMKLNQPDTPWDNGSKCEKCLEPDQSWFKLTAQWTAILGAVSIRKTVLPGMAIPMLKIRRIFNMEIAIRR